MNIKNKIVAVAAVVLLFGGVGTYLVTNQNDDTPKQSSTQKQVVKKSVNKIEFSADKKQVNYTGEVGKTALANLQALTSVETKDSSYGKMVVGIDGLMAEDSKTYWAFYVNGAYANEGAGTYKTQAGDALMWKLEDVQL